MTEKRRQTDDSALDPMDGSFAWDPADIEAAHQPHVGSQTRAIVWSPEYLFDALDGADVSADDHHWRLEVFSVVSDQTSTWVQLRLAGPPDRLVTMKLPPRESAAHAVSVLSSWLRDDAPWSHIISGTD
jgi:hypothetical protein